MYYSDYNRHIWPMNSSELSRKLLFYGYEEATDYLKNSPLNRYLYKLFIDVLPQHQIERPIVQLFNEVYYQCVRINYDGTPGVNIEQRYIDEEVRWIKSEKAAQLILCIVFAILKSKRNLTFHEDCFLFKITPYIKNSDFNEIAEKVSHDIRVLDISLPNEFPTMTCDAYDLPLMGVENMRDFKYEILKNYNHYKEDIKKAKEKRKNDFEEYLMSWRTVTDNYSHYTIEKLLRLFSDTDIQRQILNILHESAEMQRDSHISSYIDGLRMKLFTGKFDPNENPTIPVDNSIDTSQEEYNDYLNNLAKDRAATEEELSKAEQLQLECKQLKSQLEEQQKTHELELARLTAKHKAEITKLKKQTEKTGKQPNNKQETGEKAETKDEEQMFSISEMIADVREQFEMVSAKDFCSMYYRLSAKHGIWDEKVCKQVDAIVPSIKTRQSLHQTFDIHDPHQVNINSEVDNKYSEQDNY